MSNIKKVIGIVLALVMTVSMVSIAFAAAPEKPEYSVTVTAAEEEIEPGKSTTVTVKLTANYNVSAIEIPVYFDNTKVTVSDVQLNSEFVGASYATANDEGSDKYFNHVTYTKDDHGVVAFIYVAEFGKDVKSYEATTVMTFTVTALDGVFGETVVGCISDSVKTSERSEGTLYVAMNGTENNDSVDDLGVIVENCNLTGATATINIAGEEVANTLKVKKDFTEDVIIDTEVIGVYLDWYGDIYEDAADADATGLVYGADVFENVLEDVLTTELGDEYLVLTRTEDADGYDSTGTKIEVLAADKETVVETYYYVYFGDANCDGIIDTGDITVCSNVAKKDMPLDTIAQYIATDYNADTVVDTGDITALVRTVKKDEVADQGELAATFFEAYHAEL